MKGMEIDVLFKKAYLKEFLIGYYGEQYPIQATKRNEIGKWLKVLLSRPPEFPYHIQLAKEGRELKAQVKKEKDINEISRIKRRLEFITAELDFYKNATPVKIILPEYRGIRVESCNYVTFEAMNTLEGFVYDFFSALFYSYVDGKLEAGFTKTDAIYSFCYRHNIPMELISFQSLKKKHDRYQKKVTKNRYKNVDKMSREVSRRLSSLKIVL